MCRGEQSAEHLDCCCLACAVRAQQPVYFAVANPQTHIMNRSERSKLFSKIACADGNLAAQVFVVVATWKWKLVRFLAKLAESRDECVFKSGLVNSNLFNFQVARAHRLLDNSLRLVRLAREKLDPVAESLHVDDFFIGSALFRQRAHGAAEVWRSQLEAFGVQPGSQVGGRADLA